MLALLRGRFVVAMVPVLTSLAVASHAPVPRDPQPRASTSRQKASTRALNSSGTSWKGWCASPAMTSKRAFGIPAATDRPKRGGRMMSSSPDRTSVGAAICERRSAVSCVEADVDLRLKGLD